MLKLSISSRKVVVAVLDWGLGHATRCIPIIQQLQKNNCHITIASAGNSLALLKSSFPKLTFLELPAYRIVYPSSNMVWNIAWQLPHILKTIILEHRVLSKYVNENNIAVVISDNRYGAYLKHAHTIFLTHQIHIKTPWKGLSKLVNIGNHTFIRLFDELWVPDDQNRQLSGELSAPIDTMPIQYIGPLTRMNKIKKQSPVYDWVAILSGPEPQRTYFQDEIISQAKYHGVKTLIVEGKPGDNYKRKITENIELVSFLSAVEIQAAIQISQFVVCRAGYSSIMDVAAMQVKALLVPTPGQTEQEYLALYLKSHPLFYSQKQGQLDLSKAKVYFNDLSNHL